jgi:hypothetical protein
LGNAEGNRLEPTGVAVTFTQHFQPNALEYHRDSLSNADAHCREAENDIAVAHFVN